MKAHNRFSRRGTDTLDNVNVSVRTGTVTGDTMLTLRSADTAKWLNVSMNAIERTVLIRDLIKQTAPKTLPSAWAYDWTFKGSVHVLNSELNGFQFRGTGWYATDTDTLLVTAADWNGGPGDETYCVYVWNQPNMHETIMALIGLVCFDLRGVK